MGLKKDWGTCQRFLSGTTPCPNRDNEDFLRARHWGNDSSTPDVLETDTMFRVNNICAECGVYVPER